VKKLVLKDELVKKQGAAAAGEFEKILEHPGVVENKVIGALAQLEVGHAYAVENESKKAQAAYIAFLDLWREADPELPILSADSR
jgi:eukaryotic-like serine/threonine-protein kinase